MTMPRLHHESFSGPAAAPALVLLHGWGLHGGVWHGFVPLLRAHFNVTVIDLPGFGRSAGTPWPDDPAHLDAMLLAAAPSRSLWLGWSLGGLLALRIAARHPGRVQALTMLAATPCFVQREDWTEAMPAPLFAQFRADVEAGAAPALQRFLALQCRGSVSAKADIRFLQQVLAAAPLPSQHTLTAALDALARQDARADLGALPVPWQIILGGHDALVPRALAPHFPGPAPSVSVVEDAAHVPFVSRPEMCRDALLDFCRTHGVTA
jgi:pimeloyl-[acyl-carrier protein] methyl ester esterase